jgi:hypothetical protein
MESVEVFTNPKSKETKVLWRGINGIKFVQLLAKEDLENLRNDLMRVCPLKGIEKNW